MSKCNYCIWDGPCNECPNMKHLHKPVMPGKPAEPEIKEDLSGRKEDVS